MIRNASPHSGQVSMSIRKPGSNRQVYVRLQTVTLSSCAPFLPSDQPMACPAPRGTASRVERAEHQPNSPSGARGEGNRLSGSVPAVSSR
jgi:hypothetical protein